MRRYVYGLIGCVLASLLSASMVVIVRSRAETSASPSSWSLGQASSDGRDPVPNSASTPVQQAPCGHTCNGCMIDPRSPADLTYDGRCDRADIRVMRKAMKEGAARYAYNSDSDFDRDGDIDENDFQDFMHLYTFERERGAEVRQKGRKHEHAYAPPN